MRLTDQDFQSIERLMTSKPVYYVKKFATSIELVKTNECQLFDFRHRAAVVRTKDGPVRFDYAFSSAGEAWLKAAEFMRELSVKLDTADHLLKDWCRIHLIYIDLAESRTVRKEINDLLCEPVIERVEEIAKKALCDARLSAVDVGLAEEAEMEVYVL